MADIPKNLPKEITDKYSITSNAFRLDERDKRGRFTNGNIPFDRTGIPHTKETKKKLKEKRKGKKPSLGKHWKLSEEISKKRRGKRPNCVGWNKGKKTPLSVKEKISLTKRGNKNPAWKGGFSKLSYQIRKCFKSRIWRSDVFTRDNFICQDCGIRGGYLEAHHLKEFAQIFSENNIKSLEEALLCEELWNLNNGITLCKECHEKTKKYANNRYK